MLPDTNQSRTGRKLLKRYLYANFSLLDVFKIAFGNTQARVPFTVKASPSSVYYNFRIQPDKVEDFIRYINLPPEFEVCPMTCLQGEQADFLLTLNVYEVTGIAVGVRAEYSTYIKDADGARRYMVLEAQSSEYSMDPVDVITKKGRVEHDTSTQTVATLVASRDKKLFEASYPQPDSTTQAAIHPEWVSANDYIYWRNGICDRTFYDSGLAYPKAHCIDPESVSIVDDTHWSQFLESTPKHIVQFEEAIDFVIMPWVNI
ncbi:hypothetical protein EYC98_04775 [Halieaceae bacterium IMCC14734]|uniref:Uncharacterized protein n=1 Tax=Candidatus Litorirhabdus singularis TaxID=2518993 RepID=A0ABT3TDV3_9GAMM|nr:hypothetical protein [Candidatus Litorirhabdus singularis]MCX2980179.1 hypothetical protein [Candidatus Litorirhabdus singularis]